MEIRYEAWRDVVHTVNCVYRDVSNVVTHFHQSIEITYIVEGGTKFFIGADSRDLCEGQISFVPAYFAHGSLPIADRASAIVLIVPKAYYEEFFKATKGANYFFLLDKDKNAQIGQLMRELADGKAESSDLLCRAYVNMIFGLIARDYEPSEPKNTNNDLMLEIINYIDSHFEENLTLEAVSAHFGYSKYYFSRLFNRTFNCNLNSYINSVRSRAVSERAGMGKKTEVIIESGFNTLSSYYRAKKKNREDAFLTKQD